MLDRRFLSVNITVLGIANEPAANPVKGTQYIVGSTPTGVFAGASANSIATFDGTEWKFIAPKVDSLEVLNKATGEILKFNGTAWENVLTIRATSFITPVLAVVPTGTTLPASASAGDSFFNTDDAKLYTATATDTWDNGTSTTDGSRYASLTDYKIYTSNGSTATSESINEGGFFLNKEDNCLYIYNGTAFIKIGGNSSATSSISIATDIHSLTAAEVSAKSFSLSHSVASGEENNVLLFVSGLAQYAGTDFSVSGKNVTWNGKGLDSIGLNEGDTFIVHYLTA